MSPGTKSGLKVQIVMLTNQIRAVTCAVAMTVPSLVAHSQPATPSGEERKVRSNGECNVPATASQPLIGASGASSSQTAHVQEAKGPAREQAKEPEPIQRWWLSHDWWLVILTAGLAVVTWRLVVQTRRLVTETQATGIRQAKEMQSSLAIAKDSVALARDEFTSTHRPQIRVKHLWLTSEIWANSAVVVDLIIVNSGKTDARVIEFDFGFHIAHDANGLPAKPGFQAQPKSIQANPIPSGITYHLAGLSDDRQLNDREAVAVMRGESRLYCFGYVDYLDGSDRRRRTAFCRMLDVSSSQQSSGQIGRFVKVEDPDYEYQD